jgi:hypothetical protein
VNLAFFSFFGSVLLNLFPQEGLHYSPMRAGMTFAPLGVAWVDVFADIRSHKIAGTLIATFRAHELL